MAPETQAQDRKLELVLNDAVLTAPPESPVIPVECEVNGKKYVGNFTFRRPTIYRVAAIGARAAELQSTFNPQTREAERRLVDVPYQDFANRVATLEFVVAKKPAWWDLELLADCDVMHEVYMAYVKWRDQFRQDMASKPAGPSGNEPKS